VCVERRRAAMRCRWPNWSAALPMSKLVFTVVQFGLQSSIPFEPSRATKSGSRGGVSRPLLGPWRGNNGWAALSTAPQGSLCPGAALPWGGSWSSFVTLLSTSIQNLERWIQRTRKIGILKFCGCQWVCGKAEDPRDFSGLGCLLLPNRRVFLQEASWITWGVLSSPLERPSYWKPTSQNFALWARNVIKANAWVNSCALIILLGIARAKWKWSETEPIRVSILSELMKV
jgi:hypothetical protein